MRWACVSTGERHAEVGRFGNTARTQPLLEQQGNYQQQSQASNRPVCSSSALACQCCILGHSVHHQRPPSGGTIRVGPLLLEAHCVHPCPGHT